jgi:hypothetical protein
METGSIWKGIQTGNLLTREVDLSGLSFHIRNLSTQEPRQSIIKPRVQNSTLCTLRHQVFFRFRNEVRRHKNREFPDKGTSESRLLSWRALSRSPFQLFVHITPRRKSNNINQGQKLRTSIIAHQSHSERLSLSIVGAVISGLAYLKWQISANVVNHELPRIDDFNVGAIPFFKRFINLHVILTSGFEVLNSLFRSYIAIIRRR